MSVTTDQARDIVARAIRRIAPEADLQGVPEDADLRQRFELDSLDFLSFVELLSKDTGVRIDEEDYTDLVTLAGFTAFLNRAASRSA